MFHLSIVGTPLNIPFCTDVNVVFNKVKMVFGEKERKQLSITYSPY